MVEAIGYVAAVMGTFLMLPQVLQTLRTKHADDLSTLMLGLYVTQCVLWAIYGYQIHAIPVLLCNAVAFCIGLFQLYLKRLYKKPLHV